MEQAESFGTWLKRERKRRRLTQQTLGQRISYSVDHIRKVEADERRFGDAQARLLADVFTIPDDMTEAFVAWARGGTTQPALLLDSVLPGEEQPHPSPPTQLTPMPSAAVPSFPSPTADLRSPSLLAVRNVSCRALGLLVCCSLIVCLLMGGVATLAYRQGHTAATGRIVPGGLWHSPGQHFVSQGDIVRFAARAYPTHPGDPAIDHVNFTVS